MPQARNSVSDSVQFQPARLALAVSAILPSDRGIEHLRFRLSRSSQGE